MEGAHGYCWSNSINNFRHHNNFVNYQEIILNTLLYEIKYKCLVNGNESTGFLYYVSAVDKSKSQIQEEIATRNKTISNGRITDLVVTNKKICAGAIDLENTVVPFYEKLRDKLNHNKSYKLTGDELKQLIRYSAELKIYLDSEVSVGRGYDAIQYYLKKLDAIYNSQSSKLKPTDLFESSPGGEKNA